MLDAHQNSWNEKVARKIIAELEKRRMEGSYAPSAAQARKEILAMIPEGSSVYRCGSMTLVSMGFWEEVAKIPGVRLIDPFEPGLSPEESLERRRQGLLADILVTSSNAVTLDGKLVNLDGMGNRVAAMIFGPKKVILAVGMNKVVADVDAAMARVKHYSAPVNTIRLGFKNPCLETGLCADCRSPQRICNAWTVIQNQMIQGRIHVKLIGEHLGY
ncbi:MAG: lactate utilization protein [bacterium]